MKNREKIAWGLAVLSIAIMISYFVVAKGKYVIHQQTVNNLRLQKVALDKDIESLKEKNGALVITLKKLNESLQDADSVIAELKARPEPISIVRWKRIPADCKTCMENNSLPITVIDDKKWIETKVKDAFQPEKGASVKFLPNFDKDILAPVRKQVKDCEGSLETCSALLNEALYPGPIDPEKPYSFVMENGVYLGAGYIGNENMGYNVHYSGRFVRIGSRDGLNANLGINAGGFSPLDGRDIEVYGVFGAEIKW